MAASFKAAAKLADEPSANMADARERDKVMFVISADTSPRLKVIRIVHPLSLYIYMLHNNGERQLLNNCNMINGISMFPTNRDAFQTWTFF